jgi:hypothetical protein
MIYQHKMARIYTLSFLTYLLLQVLLTPSHAHAYQHRHQRRTVLYSGHDHLGQGHGQDSVVESVISQDAKAEQQRINDLQIELEANLILRETTIRLLDRESSQDSHKEKRWARYRRDDHNSSESISTTIRALQQTLEDLNETIESLYDLLASSLGKQSFTTSLSTTPTSTPTPNHTTIAPIPYTTQPSYNTTTSPTPSPSRPASSRSSTSISTTATAARYTFDPMSTSNVAVYYGQSDQTATIPLSTVCADPSVDIIILAFIHKLSTGPAGYPGLNMGARCWATSPAQAQAGASGLIDCVGDGFVAQVQRCQASGKKVLLSIGGAVGYSETTIASDADAVRIADNIWQLFGANDDNNEIIRSIRPFGDVVLDGFDIGKFISPVPPKLIPCPLYHQPLGNC